MINGALIARNATGRLITSSGAGAVLFNGGTPVLANGSLKVDINSPQFYNGGLGYVGDSLSVTADGGAVTGFTAGGLGTGLLGRIAVSHTNPIVGYIAGLPVDAAGRLCIVAPVVVLDGFSDGFDGGFS